MTDTQSMAMRAMAIEYTHKNEGREDFLSKMEAANLPCALVDLNDPFCIVDLAFFDDGSGFFADQVNTIYTPWPADDYQPGGAEAEFLPVLDGGPHLSKIVGSPYSRITFVEGDHPHFDEHLRAFVRKHSDPPEALRDMLVPSEHDFEWTDQAGAHEAKSMIILITRYICPAATEIIIRASSKDGQTRTQKSQDGRMFATLATGRYATDDIRSMEAMYKGLASAEITDLSSGDYDELNRANEVLAEVSTEILARHGRPIGWSVDYNDGARERVSGYSAHRESEEIDLGSGPSNHQLLDLQRTIWRYLQANDLLDGFQASLKQFGYKPLPDPEKAKA